MTPEPRQRKVRVVRPVNAAWCVVVGAPATPCDDVYTSAINGRIVAQHRLRLAALSHAIWVRTTGRVPR